MGAPALGLVTGAGPPRPRPPCACASTCENKRSAAAIVSGDNIFEIRVFENLCCMLVSLFCKALFPGGQALVNGLDKRAGGSLLRAVLGLIGLGRMRCFDLIECLPLLDQV